MNPYKNIKKICIDPGRGGLDTGAKLGDTFEKYILFDAAQILKKALAAAGFETYLTRKKNENISRMDRCISTASADFVISVQVARDKDSEKHGPKIGFFWTRNQKFATPLSAALKTETYFDQLQLLQDVDPPAVSLQIAHATNPEDVEKMQDARYLKKIAAAVVAAMQPKAAAQPQAETKKEAVADGAD